MKTFNELEMELTLKIQIKDEEILREYGFDFERTSTELLEEYFHNVATNIRWSKKMKGLEKCLK